jgi:beta propeller repeat protein
MSKRVCSALIILLFETMVSGFETITISAIQDVRQRNPDISGNIVVWEDNRNGDYDIYGYNVVTQEEFTVSTANGSQRYAAIDENIVVWQDYRNDSVYPDIYGYNLETQEEFFVATAIDTQGRLRRPGVSDNLIVWLQDGGDTGVYGYDIISQNQFFVDVGGIPDIENNIVVWGSRLTRGKDLSTGGLYEVPSDMNHIRREHVSISGDIMVWEDNRNNDNDIYGFDFNAEEEFLIFEGAGMQSHPDINSDIVVWEDESGNNTIYGKMLSGGPAFKISNTADYSVFPAISDNVVVWVDATNDGQGDIYGAFIPEPATLALVALGVVCGRRRRTG